MPSRINQHSPEGSLAEALVEISKKVDSVLEELDGINAKLDALANPPQPAPAGNEPTTT